MVNSCRICSERTETVFNKRILSRYDVAYHQCRSCGFIQTDEPFWLDEAYSNAISSLDVGILRRNSNFVSFAGNIIDQFFNTHGKFLDFGGGYGIFTRMMRDQGYDFYREDPLCENLLARGFDTADVPESELFEMVTAFEVFEHLQDPMNTFEGLAGRLKGGLLISTELVPPEEKEWSQWWYLTPETGQHISFFTKQALSRMAARHGLHLYSDGKTLHLFTKMPLQRDPFLPPPKRWFRFARRAPKVNRSLIESDYERIKNRIAALKE